MKSLIVGAGEIGSGLLNVLSHVYKDISVWDNSIDYCQKPEGRYDVIHICIPGGLPNFVEIVKDYIDKHNPYFVIVHSTVPIGTCKKISPIVVHSPVRGKHPDMAEGIKAYIKYVGFNDLQIGKEAERYLQKAGIDVFCVPNTDSTEAAKILSTTRYGVNLAFAQVQKDLCDKLGLDYNVVVKHWEGTYNDGLKRVNLEKYTRPVLDPPNNYIGGHCVFENAKMLLEQKLGGSRLVTYLESIIKIGKGDRND